MVIGEATVTTHTALRYEKQIFSCNCAGGDSSNRTNHVYAKQNAGGRYTTLVTINSFLGVFQVYLSTDRPVQNDVINLGDWVPGEPLELNGVKYDYVPNGHENLWP